MIRAFVGSRWTQVGTLALLASMLHLLLWGQDRLSPTINVVKIEWTLVAVCGVLFSLEFIRDSADDWYVLGDQPDRGDLMVVEILLLIGGFMVLVHALLLILGVLSMFSVVDPARATPLSRAVGVFFVVVGQSLILFLAAIRSKRSHLRAISRAVVDSPQHTASENS